jgi:hypothetical protein
VENNWDFFPDFFHFGPEPRLPCSRYSKTSWIRPRTILGQGRPCLFTSGLKKFHLTAVFVLLKFSSLIFYYTKAPLNFSRLGVSKKAVNRIDLDAV